MDVPIKYASDMGMGMGNAFVIMNGAVFRSLCKDIQDVLLGLRAEVPEMNLII